KDVAAAQRVRPWQPGQAAMQAVRGEMKALVLRADDDAASRGEDTTDLSEIGVGPLEELDDVPQRDHVERIVGERQSLTVLAVRPRQRARQPASARGRAGLRRHLHAAGVPAAGASEFDELAGPASDVEQS